MERRARAVGASLVVAGMLVSVFAVASFAGELPPGGTFSDDNGNIHEGNIEAIAADGVTKGCNPPANNLFCPSSSVTRGQMAAFLVRALNLPSTGTDFFTDDGASGFESDINRLAAAGITKGCNPPENDEFCPETIVTREVMAAFLVRAFDYADTGGGGLFADTADSMFRSDIDRLATAGVTKGCDPPDNDRFCPNDPVLRDQMASFLARALGLPAITPPPANPLMAIDDLVFTGAFRLKNGDFGVSNINYAVGALAYNPANDSLFIVGHANQSAVAEYPIPEAGMQPAVADLPESADPLQPFADVLAATTDGNPDSLDRITGMMVVDGALIVNAETWYDAPGDNTYTTLVVPDVDNLGANVGGFFRLDGAVHAGGYMSPIPAAYQEAFGAGYLTGWSSVYSIVSRYSVGPSLWTFDSADLLDPGLSSGESVTATAFMNFGFSEGRLGDRAVEYAPQGQAGPFEPASPLWNILSRGRYGFIVPGTRTFAVIGSTGGLENGIGYKAVQDDGNLCGGPCPYTAGDSYNYYWLFDVDEILGADNVFDPRPYDYGKWSVPYDNGGANKVIGATFDPDGGVLYVALGNAAQVGTYDRPPLILTFQVSP